MDRIVIPNVERDERIGSVFNHLFNILFTTHTSGEDSIAWNFSNVSFLHPFFLAPLGVLKQSYSKTIHTESIPPRLRSYFATIHLNEPLLIDTQTSHTRLQTYIAKTYLPLCQFSLSNKNIEDLTSPIISLIISQSKTDNRLITPLNYFFGELIDNMFEHSRGHYGYLFAQSLQRDSSINLMLADDGQNILQSYLRTDKYINDIHNSPAIALKLACEGKSTKNRPNAENRGFGISTTSRMLVEGLGGAFFILSGQAFHRCDHQQCLYAQLPPTIQWPGTVILLKIPTHIPRDFNYTNYLS